MPSGAGLTSRNAPCQPCLFFFWGDIKMEINVILQAISTVGFPIVVAGAMFWKMNKQDEVHKEELNKVTEAITNNTIALTRLIDKLNN